MFTLLEKVHEPVTVDRGTTGPNRRSKWLGGFRDLRPNILDADRPRAPGGRQRGTRCD